ncbi:MAG: helix-turn-helix domain-containing protein, partial [Halobacteria archaeon]|nr:helix-turn-helix domain-containing protein [Halobacteria archaeon]
DEPMTVGKIHESLRDRGHERSENTVRHHVNRLRDAGLIEVARLEEGRGGTKKYYKANTIVLSYTLPEKFDDEIDIVIEDIRPEVRRVLDKLEDEHSDTVEEIADEMAPCEHCSNQKYREYILLTLLRKAFVREYQD